jgi:hypothetical protein
VDVKEEPEAVEGSIAKAPSVITPFIPKKNRKPRKPKAEDRKSRRDIMARDNDDDDNDEMGSSDSETEGANIDGEEPMAVDKTVHVFSKRTMRDQFGNYPEWMNKRKMKTQQKKNKRIAKNRALSVSGKKRKKL